MYDSFDNMYQATIGIDFLSKVSTVIAGLGAKTNTTLRPCTSKTEPCDCSYGIPLDKNDSEV